MAEEEGLMDEYMAAAAAAPYPQAAGGLPPLPPRQQRYRGGTGTAVATFRKNGELFAVAHTHRKTGYRAHKWEAKFEAGTSYGGSFTNQQDLSYSGSDKTAKALIPYNANAQRNRLPVSFANERMSRRRFLRNRNAHQSPISIKDPTNTQRFVTSNQRTYAISRLPVGCANQGIAAELSKWMHKRSND